MEKSQSIQNIAKALITFHIKADKIKKDAKNPFFKSAYASLSNILESINDPLTESGLSFAQFPTGEHGLTTILMHGDSGEFIESNYTMRPVKDDPQGIGSCITYQRRYALCAILGLNVDDDDDANKASGKNGNNSYNRNHIETEKKPLISNKALQQGVERIKAGELGVYDSIVKSFSLEVTQKGLLEETYNNAKQTA